MSRLKPVFYDLMKTKWMVIATFAGSLIFASAPVAIGQRNGSLSYRTKCAVCHGLTGLGDTSAGKRFNVTSFKDPAVLALSDATLGHLIVNGSGKMPAYKGKLPDAEVTSLIQYIHTLQNGQ